MGAGRPGGPSLDRTPGASGSQLRIRLSPYPLSGSVRSVDLPDVSWKAPPRGEGRVLVRVLSEELGEALAEGQDRARTPGVVRVLRVDVHALVVVHRGQDV